MNFIFISLLSLSKVHLELEGTQEYGALVGVQDSRGAKGIKVTLESWVYQVQTFTPF